MIWLIGNRGMLGSAVEERFKRRSLEYAATDLDVDITDSGAMQRHAALLRPAWIVNCSAYTSVDGAEDDRDRAFAVNDTGVRNIARAAREHGARLIHISTDYVFDGTKEGAYHEDDPALPLGVYGWSKLAGERGITGAVERHFILRISWLYGPRGSNFVLTMLRLFNDRDEVRVVNDQRGSPTYAADVADALVKIIDGDPDHYGIYHYGNDGCITWYEFAQRIYDSGRRHGLVRREVRLLPITTAEYPTRARRPGNSCLSKDTIRRELGITCRGWEEALDECIRAIAHASSGPAGYPGRPGPGI